eukprot:CAMPEP_0114510318 /NCGR_PEP_ID=MMETSP0109-20121206/13715_1 /TAXON_ID=29199 /ORGANISM="Chlorarachnion reptans, Strain CCCM449" /LENGTH=38 /DNA_ID= /DNA_START= /DNA_END= /DNA_ORIENTATION=
MILGVQQMMLFGIRMLSDSCWASSLKETKIVPPNYICQ